LSVENELIGVMVDIYYLSIPYYIWLFDLFLFLILISIAVITNKNSTGKARKSSLSLIIFIIALLFYYFIIVPTQIKINLTNGSMKITIPPFTRKTILQQDVLSISIEEVSQNQEFAVKKRLGSFSLGDYKIGWFQLKNNKKAIFLLNQDKSIVFRLKDWYILVSPDNFDLFMNSLQEKGFLKTETNRP